MSALLILFGFLLVLADHEFIGFLMILLGALD